MAVAASIVVDRALGVESMSRVIADMKVDLLGTHPSRLIRMMVDQIIALWIEIKYLDSIATTPGQSSIAQTTLLLKRRDSAHTRYMGAVKTLTMMRTLAPAGLGQSDSIQFFDPQTKKA